MRIPHTMGILDLVEVGDQERNQRRSQTKFGSARLDRGLMCIYLDSGYEVDCEAIPDVRELMDWIFHLRTKTWCTSDVLGDFIEAFDQLFRETFGDDCRKCLGFSWDWATGEVVPA